ncbi:MULTISPECIES: EAL domain-containing protein [unclassified Pseudoalteromonas]|uniref:EAL domain-containing protein n=1 Tax=unclassified Pseudoalteromonas TaxID=194690 RepID=UPI003014D165
MWLSVARQALIAVFLAGALLAMVFPGVASDDNKTQQTNTPVATFAIAYGELSNAQFAPLESQFYVPKAQAVWLKANINETRLNEDVVLTVERPLLGQVAFYHRDSAGSLSALDGEHVTTSLRHFSPHLIVHEPKRLQHVYIKITSPYRSQSQISLTSYANYHSQVDNRLFASGVFSGVLLLLSVYMFATGLLSKRASLLSIAGYILSLGGFYIIHQGLTDVFFSYQTTLTVMQYSSSLLAAALGCCLLFFYHFLVRRRLTGTINTMTQSMAYGYLLVAAAIVISAGQLAFAVQAVLVLVALAVAMAVLLQQQQSNRKEVWFCGAVWMPILLLMGLFAVGQLTRTMLLSTSLTHLLVSSHLVLLLGFVVWHDSESRKNFIKYTRVDKDTELSNKFALFTALEELELKNKAHTLLLFKPLILPTIKLNFGLSFANQYINKLFKKVSQQINTYGNAAIANPVDTEIYRLEEDVFAIILDGKIEVSQVEQYVCILSSVFEEGVGFKDTKIVDSLEVGVANHPMHAKTTEKLVQRALQALNTKSQNGQRWHLFDVENSMSSERQLQLSSHLKGAIEQNQFSLFFQPQVNLTTGKVFGSEALLRWLHPDFGYIPPDEFIPIAESSGQIFEITEWVLEQALHYQAQITQVMPDHVISINISGRDLNRKELSVQLITLINELSLAPSQIMIEITESVTIGKEAELQGVLDDYRSIGVKVAIDDFGTGYSSLAYLSKLGFDELKIDKSFVMDIETSKSNQTICKATCDMAHNLGSKVVAEGVEDVNSYIRLQAYGCDYAQGYFISRPLPFNEYISWLTKVSDSDDIKSFLVR